MPKEQEHLDSCQQLHLNQCKPHNHYINYQHCHPSCHNTHGATHQVETHVGTTDLCTQRRHGWWRMQCLPQLPWYGRGFLVCQNLEVASPPAVVANMYSNQKNSMTISLTVKMLHKMTKTNALLDSRATPNFINPCTIASLFMGTRDLHILLTVNNMDGSTNWGGTITQFCNLWIRHGSCVEKLGHYITNLGQDRIILGYPWFQKFNPHFDWTANTLEGDDVVIKTAGYNRCYKPSIQTMQPLPSEPTNWVEVIKLIPEHYHWHWRVFSEQALYHFPPAQEEDHAIILKPGAPATIDCWVYHQMEMELEGTCQFIIDALAKGYITNSKSYMCQGCFTTPRKMVNSVPL